MEEEVFRRRRGGERRGGEEEWRSGGVEEEGWVHVCNKKRVIMDHEGEGPSMSDIITNSPCL